MGCAGGLAITLITRRLILSTMINDYSRLIATPPRSGVLDSSARKYRSPAVDLLDNWL
jgi:hypothetical protein